MFSVNFNGRAKKWMVLSFAVLLILLLGVAALFFMKQASENNGLVFYSYGDIDKTETRINTTIISGVNTIVLPSTVSEDSVVLYSNTDKTLYVSGALGNAEFKNGQALDLKMLCNQEDYNLKFYNSKNSDECIYELSLCFSKKIPAVYLTSDDPYLNGRPWVEASVEKDNKATGSIFIQKASGDVVYGGALTQIKGRGNTTWGFIKKPYQIKLDEKVDLLETGDDKNKSKTWILLANYIDSVGIRNALALNLGAALGMPVNIQGNTVDLYYDGEYRGMYMLTEKVEVGSGRVDIEDLDEKNENANSEIDFDTFPISSDVTENGATYTYCEGMKSPEDISGGYLLEMDYETRALEEICYFKTKRGMYVVVKSPEYASKEEMDYIATLYQEYEDAVFENGVNPSTGKKYSDYIDVRSVACYYLVNEFSKSRDCFQSSAYLHKNSGDGKFYMGPLWDYDMSFGKSTYDYYKEYEDDSPFGISTLEISICQALFEIEDFYNTFKDIYLNEFMPLVNNVILGDKDAVSDNGSLRSLAYYSDLISDSAYCNIKLWHEDASWDEEVDKLYDFIDKRQNALNIYFEKYPNIFKLPKYNYYDVFENDTYYDDVIRAWQKKLLYGVGNGMFNPESKVTRADAAHSIYYISGITDAEYEPIYSDVSESAWYNSAVVWVSKKEIMEGYEDGTFKPKDKITREEFIDALYRYVGLPKQETTRINEFTDADLVTKRDAVEWAINKGIIRAEDAENTINPLSYLTRAELATILLRFFGK